MAKIKTKQLTIDWVEAKAGFLVGYVADYGPATSKIVEELVDIPLDVPDLKSKLLTKEVTIVYPENFSDERKQGVMDKMQELYPEWKLSVTAEKNLHAVLPEISTEQVA